MCEIADWPGATTIHFALPLTCTDGNHDDDHDDHDGHDDDTTTV